MSDRDALLGLVLAGGQSRRMGADKGGLQIEGSSLAERAHRLLERHCREVVVSVRASQAGSEPYRRFRLVRDAEGLAGPVAGLLAAWDLVPGRAVLTLAVDLPLVDARILDQLIAGRDPQAGATAFRHPDGTIEPLCTIWEAAAARDLQRAATSRGSVSLRRWLEAHDVKLLEADESWRLANANTPEALAEAVARVARGSAGADPGER